MIAIRRALPLWLVLVAAYAVTLGCPGGPGRRDAQRPEAHRLLAAESVVSDGDVDLRDEYTMQAWRDWYSGPLGPAAAADRWAAGRAGRAGLHAADRARLRGRGADWRADLAGADRGARVLPGGRAGACARAGAVGDAGGAGRGALAAGAGRGDRGRARDGRRGLPGRRRAAGAARARGAAAVLGVLGRGAGGGAAVAGDRADRARPRWSRSRWRDGCGAASAGWRASSRWRSR